MESFAKLMCTIGASSSEVDFVTSLPLEIAQLILRKLDPRSLLNAASVSTKWLTVCKGDSLLKKTARRHLRREKRSMIQGRGLASRQNKTNILTGLKVARMQTKIVPGSSRQSRSLSAPLTSRVSKLRC